MAYSKTPIQDTYQTKQIPLLSEWETRNVSNLKDVDSVNVIWEVVADKVGGNSYYEAIKRDGLSAYGGDMGGTIFSTYYWSSNNRYVLVGSFGIRAYDATTGALLGSNSTVLTNAHIGYAEFLYQSGAQSLIISDIIHSYVYDGSSTVTQITDPDYPATHVPYPVVLDGYVFIADTTGNIWNSDNNNPLSWSSSNFITAEAYPDVILALGRLGQYIVAFGQTSIQFFWDAANPTGTPLAMQSTVLRIGFEGGLVGWGDSLYFLGTYSNSKPTVCKLKGFQVETLGTPSIIRRLQEVNQTIIGAVSTFERNGVILNINGHSLYTWIDIDPTTPQTYLSTYALDLENGLWTRLEYAQFAQFPVRSAVTIHTNSKWITIVALNNGSQPLQFLPTNYSDPDGVFSTTFQTRNLDFGTRRLKFASRLLVAADQTPTTSFMTVSWSDDDYQTFIASRNVDLSLNYPVLWQLGKFRKRGFKFEYTDNFPMRWSGIELDYNQGQE